MEFFRDFYYFFFYLATKIILTFNTLFLSHSQNHTSRYKLTAIEYTGGTIIERYYTVGRHFRIITIELLFICVKNELLGHNIKYTQPLTDRTIFGMPETKLQLYSTPFHHDNKSLWSA